MYKEMSSIFFVKGVGFAVSRWPALGAARCTWQNELARSLVQQTHLLALSAHGPGFCKPATQGASSLRSGAAAAPAYGCARVRLRPRTAAPPASAALLAGRLRG
jgi:hypothetical protein